jgi:hypothetical protein
MASRETQLNNYTSTALSAGNHDSPETDCCSSGGNGFTFFLTVLLSLKDA